MIEKERHGNDRKKLGGGKTDKQWLCARHCNGNCKLILTPTLWQVFLLHHIEDKKPNIKGVSYLAREHSW